MLHYQEQNIYPYKIVNHHFQSNELIEDNNPQEIKGLIYRNNERIIFTGRRTKLLDLDNLPFPAYNKLKGFPQEYLLPIFNYPRVPATSIVTSRGCPFQCSYCDRSVYLKSYRYNSAEYIIELLKYLDKTFGIRHVNIYDDTFLLNRKRIVNFCELKQRNNIKMTFNCAARAEQVDPDLLRLLKKSGCWMISLGIETGDPELLSRHRSYGNSKIQENALELIKRKIYYIKKAGILVKGLFILGLPGETLSSINKSMEFVCNIPLDSFTLSRFTPFPGSPLYRDIMKSGKFIKDWKLMNALNFVYIPNGFTKEQLEDKYHEFCRKYYKRMGIILKYISMVWKSPHSWYRFLRNIPKFLNFTKKYKE